MTNIFDQMAEPNSQAASSEAIRGKEFESNRPDAGETDVQRTSPELKWTIQELLKHGYLEEEGKQEHFRRIVTHTATIDAALEPLDLTLRIDTHRGVAFLAVSPSQADAAAEDNGWSHALVRKQRLTLEQSLLVAILRQAFALHEQEFGVGHTAAKVSVDELLATYVAYVGDSGSDARNESRLLQILEQLKTHGIVSEVDKNHEIAIRPLIAYMANADSLSALLRVLNEKRQTLSGPEDNE